ncbi:DEAD/DEAH box helicase [Candidatus Dependentiae bacterium]|nr:DEAD/DEAH box helicase [Candidatus Dependentiae bacterium]
MSKYSNEKRRSEKKDSFMPATGKSGTKSYGTPSGKPKTGSSQGFNRNPKPAQSRKAVKSYNPLLFIKKVEEQSVAAVYTPKHNFVDFLIDDQIKANISARGYVTPTPIQDQAIPLLLQGKDVIATANTGTGKTAAFLIPLVHNVLTKKINRVLIVTPTRELAAQIQSELDFFKAKTGLGSVLCIGGLSLKLQMQQLKKEPAFIIGTPGRLLDLEQNASLHFRKYDAIVLDEVDTMLDMGFINDIKYIIGKLPEKRHSLFFSATISPAIAQVMDGFLHNPVSISVKTRQSSENVNQDVVKVAEKNKIEVLHDLLIKPAFTRVIIFSRTKRATDKLAKALKERGFEAAAIHGDKTQTQRKKALDMFKADAVKILLATDVVARGIDIDDVSHVINYDLPQTYEDYIHRIGRTGRASKIGQALTFIE